MVEYASFVNTELDANYQLTIKGEEECGKDEPRCNKEKFENKSHVLYPRPVNVYGRHRVRPPPASWVLPTMKSPRKPYHEQ
ncbi:hypothetical protein J6590_005369 [Homalodisca vitripennis]|nr:hypothetical protein J6590_005369 [Homalodisca vitripennis]